MSSKQRRRDRQRRLDDLWRNWRYYCRVRYYKVTCQCGTVLAHRVFTARNASPDPAFSFRSQLLRYEVKGLARPVDVERRDGIRITWYKLDRWNRKSEVQETRRVPGTEDSDEPDYVWKGQYEVVQGSRGTRDFKTDLSAPLPAPDKAWAAQHGLEAPDLEIAGIICPECGRRYLLDDSDREPFAHEDELARLLPWNPSLAEEQYGWH